MEEWSCCLLGIDFTLCANPDGHRELVLPRDQRYVRASQATADNSIDDR
jgi:hypothetical protein